MSSILLTLLLFPWDYTEELLPLLFLQDIDVDLHQGDISSEVRRNVDVEGQLWRIEVLDKVNHLFLLCLFIFVIVSIF